jgi:hypothetical protein
MKIKIIWFLQKYIILILNLILLLLSLEIKNLNEILWVDFDVLFRLLISVNYNILILYIQKLDFIISEIDNNIYKYNTLFGWIRSKTLIYFPCFKYIHNITFINSTFLEEENHLTKYNQKQRKAVTYNTITENKSKNCRIHKLKFLINQFR